MVGAAMRFSILRCCFLVSLALTAGNNFAAEPYPVKPLHFITVLPAGPDAYIRVLAARFGEQMGQGAVVDNRPGGSGVPAVQAVLGARPDGYSLLIYSVVLLISKSLQPSLPFDPIADFAPFAKVYGGGASVLVVRPDSPFRNVQDLIAQAKATPGKLTHGGPIGLLGHLNAASFLAIAGVKGFHVPFKSTGDDMPAILRGDIDFTFLATTVALPQVVAGKFRALAVTSADRIRALPEVPTMRELLNHELLVQDNWTGLAVHAKTPEEIVRRLNAETVKALLDPGVRKAIESGGNEPAADESPEQFVAFSRRELDKRKEIVKLTGVKLE